MKGFYIENFVLRLLFCIVGMLLVWIAVQYIMDTFIFHEPFGLGLLDYVIPVVMGIFEAISWKPKN